MKAMWASGKAGFKDDARVKFKVAAELFWPFRFMVAYGRKLAKKRGGGWEWKEEFAP